MKKQKGIRFLSLLLALIMVVAIIPATTIKAEAATATEQFVTRCYQVTLGRKPDKQGLKYWTEQLDNGGKVGSVVANGFLFSDEYLAKKKSNKAYINDLYKLFMDRKPDEDGYNYWNYKLKNGESRQAVFAGFANSKEFSDICVANNITAGYFSDNYDIEQVNNVNLFVARLYKITLGRIGDKDGQEYWVKGLLEGKITGADCAVNFINSKEYVNKKLSSEEYVDNLYMAFMNREADYYGRKDWVGALEMKTKTRDQVLEGFVNSTEFKQICNKYKIKQGSYTATDIADLSKKKKYKKFTLDGDAKHLYTFHDFSYLESDKYFLFVEKDISIPGDFAKNLDLIINEVEKQLDLDICMQENENVVFGDTMTSYHGFNPWEGKKSRGKLAIYLATDPHGEGYISWAFNGEAFFVMYETFSEELWNSIPEYRDNPWRRNEYIDYTTIAHELTHAIALRNAGMTDIVTEGIAEYMGREVVNSLAKKYPQFRDCRDKRYLYDNSIPEAVNAKNAERIFVGDYQEISHADRGAEYVTGMYLCYFLKERYGSKFYGDYSRLIKKKKLDYNSLEDGKEVTQKYADAMKELFGDDVFKDFGNWCVKNNHLQELGGVW